MPPPLCSRKGNFNTVTGLVRDTELSKGMVRCSLTLEESSGTASQMKNRVNLDADHMVFGEVHKRGSQHHARIAFMQLFVFTNAVHVHTCTYFTIVHAWADVLG